MFFLHRLTVCCISVLSRIYAAFDLPKQWTQVNPTPSAAQLVRGSAFSWLIIPFFRGPKQQLTTMFPEPTRVW
jgi:hypothetical protein